MFRPQFARPDAPEGFIWQPCIYQYDVTNTPAFQSLALVPGSETGYIPLDLDRDAPFVLLAIRMVTQGLNVQLWDPYNNPLMEDYTPPEEYAGHPPFTTILEGPGIECVKGGTFQVRLQAT